VTLAGVWAYLKFGTNLAPKDKPANEPAKPEPAKKDAPIVAMPTAPIAPVTPVVPVAPAPTAPDKPKTVVDKAGDTTNGIAGRRNAPPANPTEDITKKRRP
jgi:hypothetical protein